MSRIIRWDPFREMISVRNQLDQIVDDFFRTPATWQRDAYNGYRSLALDVSENDDTYIVKSSLPGIDLSDLDIRFSENTLTIQGETQAEQADENEKWHLRERRFGSFRRSITLPTAINADQIKAHYENGILTLSLPKSEEVRPRKITVHANEQQTVQA